jgi:protein O-GlcNAc transferase
MKIDPARTLYLCCPLCASTELLPIRVADCSGHPLYHPDTPPTIQWKQCTACGHVFTEGYFSDKALDLLFSKTNEKQQLGFDLEKQRHVSARMIERVLPFQSGGDWLDVGFGNGSLLFTATEFGFTPVGLDLRKDNVSQLSNIGVEAHCVDISELKQESRYSVISLCDVLEHMPFPAKGLTAAHRLLKSGGVLFLSMPNMDSILWGALNNSNSNPYWGELEHYHNFGRKRLYQLLEEFNFEPVRFGISERYRVCMEVVAIKVG